jgi:hypothetical protein
MAIYEFAVIASGVDPEAEDFEDRFFAAGCDDATLAFQRGAIILDFAREARSFEPAVASAVRDVRKAGATVERIEPDSLVSLSDIAARTGLTRAAISLYATGQRGAGFPAPVSRVTSESPLWDWVAVASWMGELGKSDLPADALEQARAIRKWNARLSAERETRKLPRQAAE